MMGHKGIGGLVTVLGLVAVLGCESADTPEPAPNPPPQGEAPPAVADSAGEPAALEPVPPDTGWSARDSEHPAAGGMAVLTAVRTARHPGFDRIVLEFAGDTLPGYGIAYVDRPQHQCGSGDEVWLAGDAWLSIKLEPAQAHTDSGAATIADRARKPGLPNLLELRLTCDFEGQVEWVAGVANPAGYRVLRLSRPARLVVDVRHPGQGG